MTTPNAGLAYRVLDHIDAHPKQWDQGAWGLETSCGTVACFAGWACLLSGDSLSSFYGSVIVGDALQSVDLRALRLLGITHDDADRLFLGTNSRSDLGRTVTEIFGPRPDGGDAR